MMTLATRGQAVSPVTSYLAIEPGVRPSTEGIETGEGQGFGSGHGMLHMGAKAKPKVDHAPELIRALRSAWTSCHLHGAVKLTVETTLDEIVEVTDITPVATEDANATTCIEAMTWALALPPSFDEQAAAFHVTVDESP
jgi:hypothetical protein